MTTLQGEHVLITGAPIAASDSPPPASSPSRAPTSRCSCGARRAPSRIAGELRALGVRVGVVTADVSDRSALFSACHKAAEQRGPVTILVNNAGSVQTVPFLKSEPALFHKMYAVHLMGPVHATQAVLPGMLERGSGSIVNVASIAGLVGAAYVSAYVAAKHAMVGLTRALAVEFQSKGIRANAVCPGYTDTDLVSDAVQKIVNKTGRSAEEAMAIILADAGQERLVHPDEVAAAVLSFCDPRSMANGESRPLMGHAEA